ncbi:microcin C transport system substrate-binding protein [Cognatiyoonia sediminum]|uniref:Microcin C transport system substrate-binding protein n=1 Tax=Cognatiyoonia sediminum TaxID=1508389 RepID=A0A1M5PPU7_9RHOB|nr:extracellular solute-binding protein [Cognatiyoonia sediminum]SHH03837.1 microcin C transport system substrate-binding protein [Cognatiyoonia sediminum]
MQDHRPTAKCVAVCKDQSIQIKQWMLGSAIVAAGALCAFDLRAEGHEEITVSHGFTNFGDLKYGPDESLEYVNVDAPKGGEIAVWAQGSFDSFNQYAREGSTASLNQLPYENVLTGTADDPYGSYCYLCETMEYPESLDWVIFNLRDDVTFSDGTPMTAEDLEFTFNLFQEQGIVEYRNVVSQYIADVEVLDTHKIKFSFTEEAPRRDVVGFAGGTPVFSKAWFEETGTRLDESSDMPFLGTGPYLLDNFDINRRIVYKKDPNWWGADRPINQGRNNFDTIRVEYFADGAAAFEGFKSGAYTFRNENSSKQWATGYEFPAQENGWVKVEELPDGSIGTGQGFVFNLDRETWQDPRVREAISLMVNFEWMNESLFYGLYARPESFWDYSDLKAEGPPSEGEIAILQPLVDEGLLDASILTADPVVAPISTSVNRPLDRRNLRAASALLDEAGWVPGENGVRMKDGETLEAVFLQFSPQFDRIVNPIVENLIALGVDAKLDRVDTSQYIERRRSGDFDLVNHSLGQGYEPGSGLRQWFGSETADNSSRNLMRLRSEAVDRLLPVVIESETLEELNTSTRALDRVLRAEGFWIPQWQKNVHTIAYYDMFRYPDELPPLALGELDFWWYDAEAAEALDAAGAF